MGEQCRKCGRDVETLGLAFVNLGAGLVCGECFATPPATELQLATVEELIEELMGRTTFRGIVMWQKEYKGVNDPAWSWRSERCNPQAVALEMAPQVPNLPLEQQ